MSDAQCDFAEVFARRVDGVPDAVFFVVVDTDEGGSFGNDGCSGVGWSAHSTDTIANSLSPGNDAVSLDSPCFMSPDPVPHALTPFPTDPVSPRI